MRLFIASRVEEPASGKISRGLAGVRGSVPRASWVKQDAYHVTYAFLGEQNAEVAAKIGEELSADLDGVPPYEGALAGGGMFPDQRRPRVGWLGFEDPGRLSLVAESVRRTLLRLGVEHDRKAFRPHLTLVRIRDRWRSDDVSTFLNGASKLGRVPVCLDRVALLRSELRPQGATHHELAVISLKAKVD